MPILFGMPRCFRFRLFAISNDGTDDRRACPELKLTRVLSRVRRQRSVRYDRCRCRGVLAFSSTRALCTHRPVTAGRRSSSRVRLFRETRTQHTLRLSFSPNLPSLFPSFADALRKSNGRKSAAVRQTSRRSLGRFSEESFDERQTSRRGKRREK